jgi:hypothetical protein
MPMRNLLFAALVLVLGRAATGDEPAKPKSGPAKVTDWKADPACRLVFHAVLEGLYEDGVTDDVVNNIVPPDKQGREKMRRSFVLDCPLCQPAFEAFCVYQRRPKFSDGGQVSTFGKGLPEAVKKGLLSDTLSTRLITLRGPIRGWVEARLRSLKLTAKERQKWWKDIAARAGQGTATLHAHMAADPWYKNWSGCWGCAACLGSQDATQRLLDEPVAGPKK